MRVEKGGTIISIFCRWDTEHVCDMLCLHSLSEMEDAEVQSLAPETSKTFSGPETHFC